MFSFKKKIFHSSSANNNNSEWTNKRASMSKQICSGEQKRNLRAYSMSRHGISLIYSFATWILWSDVTKYFTTSPRIFCHVTSKNNGLLTLNMGLAKKAINSSIVWAFENILNNLSWCILSSFVQIMLQMFNFFYNSKIVF